MPASSITTDNLICLQCGYDLRALPTESNCPECGRPISDSIAAQPLIDWLPSFRRGVSLLCFTFLIGMPPIQGWLYDKAWDPFKLNAEGVIALEFSLLFLASGWFLTAGSRSQPGMRPARKWVLALAIAQLVLGLVQLRFFRHPWPFDRAGGNHLLMTAYALEPLVF